MTDEPSKEAMEVATRECRCKCHNGSGGRDRTCGPLGGRICCRAFALALDAAHAEGVLEGRVKGAISERRRMSPYRNVSGGWTCGHCGSRVSDHLAGALTEGADPLSLSRKLEDAHRARTPTGKRPCVGCGSPTGYSYPAETFLCLECWRKLAPEASAAPEAGEGVNIRLPCPHCGVEGPVIDDALWCEDCCDWTDTLSVSDVVAALRALLDRIEELERERDAHAAAEVRRAMLALREEVEREETKLEEYVMLGPFAFRKYQRKLVALIDAYTPPRSHERANRS